MDAATIAARVSAGYARAAKVIGPEYAVYRAGDALYPLAAPVGTVRAVFKPMGKPVGAPNTPQNPWFDGLMDTSIMEPGDIVSGADGVYLVWQKPTLGAILAVQCNETLSAVRPAQVAAVGLGDYGGNTAATETPVMDGWPASMLRGGRESAGRAGLPGDANLGGWTILMPAWNGITIRTGDIIIRKSGARAIVVSAELTDGWRLLASEAAT